MRKLLIDDLDYPKMLKNIKNAPQELYVEGNIKCCNLPCITIVGSRNMSEYGEKMTRQIVKELVEADVCIVSGLAVGIDSVAHQTCLDNMGKTIAVIGSGFNKVYPPENRGLYKRIIENGGCIFSEYEPDTEAQKYYFPARNRIVSGLSLGTLVVEAAYRSGTTITAKFAFNQGRKVFCLPNSIGSKNSMGTLNLIKKGATMVTSGKEILYELGIIDDVNNINERQRIDNANLIEKEGLLELDDNVKRIYFYIKENKLANIEVMCDDLKLDIKDVNTYLTLLELKGLIVNRNSYNYSLRDELYV